MLFYLLLVSVVIFLSSLIVLFRAMIKEYPLNSQLHAGAFAFLAMMSCFIFLVLFICSSSTVGKPASSKTTLAVNCKLKSPVFDCVCTQQKSK